MNWKRIREALRGFSAAGNLLPCPLCRHGDGGGINAFCPECLAQLPRVGGPPCPGCGGALDGALAFCSQCLEEPLRPWRQAVTVFEYRGEVREVIAKFKYGNRPELARPLGILAAAEVRRRGISAAVIVPIPLHFLRRLHRSYNQAELLARVIGRELNLPVVPALRRVGRGRKQATLDRAGRHRNPRGIFVPAAALVPKISGRSVLLVDDVFTTGATLAAAAEVLISAGCGEITVLSCARGRRYSG